MTREEFEGVWALLSACREGDPRLQRRELRRAWWLVLEPYDAEDVKQAVLGFVREKNQFPFVGEITQRLPPLPSAAVQRAYDPMGASAPQPISRREAEEQMALDRAYMLRLLDQCRREG